MVSILPKLKELNNSAAKCQKVMQKAEVKRKILVMRESICEMYLKNQNQNLNRPSSCLKSQKHKTKSGQNKTLLFPR